MCSLSTTANLRKGFQEGVPSSNGDEGHRWEKKGAHPDGAYIQIKPDGRQIKIQRQQQAAGGDSDDEEGGSSSGGSSLEGETEQPKRGKITGFSSSARRRLRNVVHAVERDSINLFISLTFHEWWPTPDEAKRCLTLFRKRLDEKFPEWSSVWKMEPQERGMPHFHLLFFGPDFIPIKWLAAIWHDVTEEVSEHHRRQGVDIEHVRDDGKLQSYLAKYMCKEYDHWPVERMCKNGCPREVAEQWKEPGRFWARHHRERIPKAEWADWGVHIPDHIATQMIVDLLTEWEVDTGGAIPPSLTINTRGDPADRLEDLMERYGL